MSRLLPNAILNCIAMNAGFMLGMIIHNTVYPDSVWYLAIGAIAIIWIFCAYSIVLTKSVEPLEIVEMLLPAGSGTVALLYALLGGGYE
jgi:steroid 5-alpha reductase family enzyme